MTEEHYQQSRISFYGEDIIALQGLEPNETYIPVAQLCLNMGLERAAQERRVRAHTVLTSGARKLPVEVDNGTEVMLCLRNDLVPLWLVTLELPKVDPSTRARLELYQREAASMLWQSGRPQGFGTEDALLPDRYQQTPAEQAYAAAQAIATLARHQMLIERQLSGGRADRDEQGADPWASAAAVVDDQQAALLAQTVRRVAHALAERTRRNEYAGIFSGLYRQFGLASYRRMPPARLHEALEWLERWHGDILGEPEPPPDI
ncbi:MAG TPA: phage antirepressor N-terminal domain-containing protein [Roseiflexaceae bacterium]|nr:phage antirepressor N-terminal domain-containing protein [Roseiflexaceae bacterium]